MKTSDIGLRWRQITELHEAIISSPWMSAPMFVSLQCSGLPMRLASFSSWQSELQRAICPPVLKSMLCELHFLFLKGLDAMMCSQNFRPANGNVPSKEIADRQWHLIIIPREKYCLSWATRQPTMLWLKTSWFHYVCFVRYAIRRESKTYCMHLALPQRGIWIWRQREGWYTLLQHATFSFSYINIT